MKKRGKELELDLSKNYNVVCGTVDNKNTKSIYLNICAWGEPLDDNSELNYSKVINNLTKKVKQNVFNYLTNNYNIRFHTDRSIVDFDMRESGVKFGKRSFISCDITMFQKDYGDILSEGLPSNILSDIGSSIINNLDSSKYFNFYKKKS